MHLNVLKFYSGKFNFRFENNSTKLKLKFKEKLKIDENFSNLYFNGKYSKKIIEAPKFEISQYLLKFF